MKIISLIIAALIGLIFINFIVFYNLTIEQLIVTLAVGFTDRETPIR